jgi:hypothetical protein
MNFSRKPGNLLIAFLYNISDTKYLISNSRDMKKAFLLALAGALAFSSFAAEKNKAKGKKNKKATKTEQCCVEPCEKTKCIPPPGCCKI